MAVFGVPQSEVETELEGIIKALTTRLTKCSEEHKEYQRASNELVAQNTKTRTIKKKASLDAEAKSSKGDGRGLGEGVFDPVRLVFVSKAPTETAKRLESKLDEIMQGSVNYRDIKSKASKTKYKETLEAQRADSKDVREKLEKDLQANMESFMTRAITEQSLNFEAPRNHEEEPKWPISICWPAPDPRNLLFGNSLGEMHPDALLFYALERINIVSGFKMFRSILRHSAIIDLFVNLFWLVKIRFFQLDYDDATEMYLSNRMSHDYSIFLSFLSKRAKAEYEKDHVFKYLPFILASAVHYGFYYLCPGSRHMLTRAFRKATLVLVVQFLFGVKMSHLALKVVWNQMFPHDTVDDEDEDKEEFKPMNAGNKSLSQASISSSIMDDDERYVVSSLSKSGRPDSPCVDVAYTPYGGSRNLQPNHKDSRGSLHQHAIDYDLFSIDSSAMLKKREKQTLIRQRTTKLDLQSLSPLMRNFYSTSSLTHGKNIQLLKLTTPVSNCVVGGSDTYKKKSIPNVLVDSISL